MSAHVRLGRLASLPAVTLLLLAGCTDQVKLSTEVKPPIPVRTVAVVQKEVAASTTQPATVLPYFEAQIFANVGGYVSEVSADIGQVVTSGTPLGKLNVPELEARSRAAFAQTEKAQADLRRSESRVELAAAQLKSAESMLQQASSEVAQVAAGLAAAQAEFDRTADLVQRQSLQARMLDESRQRRDSQAAGLKAKQAAVESAGSMVGVAQAQFAAAQADRDSAAVDVRIAQAQREEADALLSYTILVAPFDGVVTARNVDPGDLLSPRSSSGEAAEHPKALFTVSQISTVRVQIPVPEHHAAHINPGDSVRLSFPSYADQPPMQANVARTAGRLDGSTRTMLVECDIDNSDGKLLPGMFGEAQLAQQASVAINMLPTRSVRFTADGKAYVYVLRGETVEVVDVETGRDDGALIEIRSGISNDQVVLDTHLRRFLGGEKVTVLSN